MYETLKKHYFVLSVQSIIMLQILCKGTLNSDIALPEILQKCVLSSPSMSACKLVI